MLERLLPEAPRNSAHRSPTPETSTRQGPASSTIDPGATTSRPDLSYPPGVFSLSHLAIPFLLSDPLYGLEPDTTEDYGANLGAMATRGERGTLIVSIDSLARMSSNPFFPYLLTRVEEGIDRPSGPSGRGLTATPAPGLPVRLEALLSTFVPDDRDVQPFAGP